MKLWLYIWLEISMYIAWEMVFVQNVLGKSTNSLSTIWFKIETNWRTQVLEEYMLAFCNI